MNESIKKTFSAADFFRSAQQKSQTMSLNLGCHNREFGLNLNTLVADPKSPADDLDPVVQR